jgi:signal recognition particle subunit SRP19
MAEEYPRDRRCVIYPSYINSKCSVADGRRIPKDAAVDAPNILEIHDVLEKSMKLPCEAGRVLRTTTRTQNGRARNISPQGDAHTDVHDSIRGVVLLQPVV